MKNVMVLLLVLLSGCDKYGVSGYANRMVGNWSEVNLPSGCVAKQVAAEKESGVVVLCQDGRVFH